MTPKRVADVAEDLDFPTSDGKPFAETDCHRVLMADTIRTLQERFATEPMVYVSGNLLVFYEPGNKRKHISPDCFVVRGVAKHLRPNYLIWKERRPDTVFEMTSSTTRREDTHKKLQLYRDVLRVPEYFLFDPFEDYLKPSMQGYRLIKGDYVPMELVDGRLASDNLGLHLLRDGWRLRLYDPVAGRVLLSPSERTHQAEAERDRVIQDRAADQAEIARLRDEIKRLRRGPNV